MAEKQGCCSKIQQFAKSFKLCMYNPETGEVMSRSGKSWLKISGFYVLFFAVLIGSGVAFIEGFISAFVTLPKDHGAPMSTSFLSSLGPSLLVAIPFKGKVGRGNFFNYELQGMYKYDDGTKKAVFTGFNVSSPLREKENGTEITYEKWVKDNIINETSSKFCLKRKPDACFTPPGQKEPVKFSKVWDKKSVQENKTLVVFFRLANVFSFRPQHINNHSLTMPIPLMCMRKKDSAQLEEAYNDCSNEQFVSKYAACAQYGFISGKFFKPYFNLKGYKPQLAAVSIFLNETVHPTNLDITCKIQAVNINQDPDTPTDFPGLGWLRFRISASGPKEGYNE